MPVPSAATARRYASARRRARPHAASSSSAPARLAPKCETSITGSGSALASQARRRPSEGDAADASSTPPASIVKIASSLGATDAVRVPKALPHCTTWWRRCEISSTISTSSAPTSGTR